MVRNMINPAKVRLCQLGRTQRELLDAIRARSIRCSRSELSEALTGAQISPKATMLRDVADNILTEWERRGNRTN